MNIWRFLRRCYLLPLAHQGFDSVVYTLKVVVMAACGLQPLPCYYWATLFSGGYTLFFPLGDFIGDVLENINSPSINAEVVEIYLGGGQIVVA